MTKDANEEEFDPKDSILYFLLYNNNRMHTITKFSLYDIIKKRSNQKIMKQVRENTLKSRKYIKAEKFKIGQTILISSQVLQSKKMRKYLNYN